MRMSQLTLLLKSALCHE
ncbi:rCG30007 [Rattus norvegicus]|uniref:RCG30007 n=1 Tax=Rattus norvegicus TaxID=10116 RepID=A6IL44_RAT|nr:rCG30007 [Rattus norvegicus]